MGISFLNLFLYTRVNNILKYNKMVTITTGQIIIIVTLVWVSGFALGVLSAVNRLINTQRDKTPKKSDKKESDKKESDK